MEIFLSLLALMGVFAVIEAAGKQSAKRTATTPLPPKRPEPQPESAKRQDPIFGELALAQVEVEPAIVPAQPSPSKPEKGEEEDLLEKQIAKRQKAIKAKQLQARKKSWRKLDGRDGDEHGGETVPPF